VPNSGRPPEDEIDGLLRAYFQAEMPDPWPSFEAPAPRHVLPLRRPQAPRFTLWRSRLALAASILLLIAGALFLFGRSPSQDAGQPTIPKTADTRGLIIPVDPQKGAESIQDVPLDGDMPMK
jgi:hypothetical protein